MAKLLWSQAQAAVLVYLKQPTVGLLSMLVVGANRTVDKPDTTVKVKDDHDVLSEFLNIRVASIQDFYNEERS